MDNFQPVSMVVPRASFQQGMLRATLCVIAAAALVACGNKDAKPRAGQTLASVNGEEITALQLNEELQRANIQAAQQEGASKQLLEALIDRQLLQNEAARDKTDRDPKVIQAIERAKALIIAQAYMQKKVGNIARPTPAEVGDYYAKHPEFFADRKQFDMRQLVIDTKDLSEQVKTVADNARSLDDVAAWFDANKLRYVRAQSTRTTSDLAPEMSKKLKTMAKGRLFVVREGERSMLVSIVDIKDNPVSLEVATPQIEKYLINQRSKEAAQAELQRLRATAKIDYLNTPAPAVPAAAVASAAAAPPAATASPASPAAAAATAPTPNDEANARGVAGLK